MGCCAASTEKSMERGTGPMAEANTVTGPVKQCESRLTAAEKRVLRVCEKIDLRAILANFTLTKSNSYGR